jgi:hypothetical protein
VDDAHRVTIERAKLVRVVEAGQHLAKNPDVQVKW